MEFECFLYEAGADILCTILSKMLGQISGVSSPHKTKETCSYPCLFLNSFQNTAHQRVQQSPLDFYLCGYLQTTDYSSPIENEETLHQIILMPVTSHRSHPGQSIGQCVGSGGVHMEHML